MTAITKGQFAMLTAGLGVATMAGAGYLAYANSHPRSSSQSGGQVSVVTGSPTATATGFSGVPEGGSGAGSGAGAGKGTGTGSGATGAALECHNTDMQVAEKDSQGAAGHISLLLVFTNVGDHACYLKGYPGATVTGQGSVGSLDAKRTLAGYSGGAVGLGASPYVLLKPGGDASAVLEWSDVPDASGCEITSAADLAVTPPNTTQSTDFTMSGQQICSGFQVHPVLSGVTRTPSGN
jgi:hypothetical protein